MRRILFFILASLYLATATVALQAAQLNGFAIKNLVSSSPGNGTNFVDPTLRDGWGIAIRPTEKGPGGHFWLSSGGNGTSNQYVGDVSGNPLYQDSLVNIDIPPYTPGYSPPAPSGPASFIPDGLGVSHPTGQTWQQTSGFVITLPHLNGPITNPAKFLFATSDGVISAWTDNKQPDGTPNWVGYAVPVIDRSSSGSSFFGITVSTASGYLYTADLGAQPGIKVFNSDFSQRSDFDSAFNPFTTDGFHPGDYAPFNVQTLNINGSGNLFVTYQKTLPDPSNPAHILAGLGETGAGLGRLAEYTPDGQLIAIWDDHGLLNSPYGIALAPANFGLASNMLLVGNAGDGSIVAFDTATRSAVDFLRDASGGILHIDGLKGLTFGNGISLGEANSLYFSAGPQNGAEGLFGKIQAVPEPGSIILFGLGIACCAVARYRRGSRKANHSQRAPAWILSAMIVTGTACLFGTPPAQAGSWLISSFGSNEVLRYNNAGAYLGVAASGGGLDRPQAFAYGPGGSLYVSSFGSDAILRYDGGSGAFQGVFTSGGGLDGPRGMTFGPDGHLYVSSGLTNQILRFDGTTGAFIDVFASGNGLSSPRGLKFGADGNLYVASRIGSSGGVLRFNGTTGAFVDAFATGAGTEPWYFDWGSDGNLYLAASGNPGIVKRYDGTTGAFLNDFVTSAQLDRSRAVAFGPDGNLYVGSFAGAGATQIQRFDGGTGSYLGAFTTGGTLSQPFFLAYVPEPATLSLTLSAISLLLLSVIRRRFRARGVQR